MDDKENIIELSEQKNPFSEYPKEMDEYFFNQEIIIKAFPTGMLDDVKAEKLDFRVTSAKQYFDYLVREDEYWREKDEKMKLNIITNANVLSTAISKFNIALDNYNISKNSQGENYISQSVSSISSGVLSSQSSLAQYIVDFIEREFVFIKGLRNGLFKSTTQLSCTLQELEGLVTAFSFRGICGNGEFGVCNELAVTLEKDFEEANINYAKLNESYTKSFHEQQELVKEINDKTNEHLKEMKEKAQQYYGEKNKRFNELETIYNNALQFKLPAQYWKDLELQYMKSAEKWLKASIGCAIVIMIVLAVILFKLPDMFSNDSNWIDVVKNSAIITVITSIAIYILRNFVKMTMSSFHLSRDAKERNMLTYFYLALLKEQGVTDKERALVINSLFSRADTGLLKNDSTPVMSNNVTELVDVIPRG